jgi:DNA-binding NarL/FixJ family response regulator
MNKKILKGTIVIADSQYLITESLKSILLAYGPKVYAVSGKKALHAFLQKHHVSLIITDHAKFDYASMDELAGLKQQYPGTAILILTGAISRLKIKELNRAGIRNIAMKTDDFAEILNAVKSALSAEKHYSREVLDLLLNTDGQTVEDLLLTPSEIEIITMISRGLTIKEMASRRSVSVNTVMTHRKNIFRKLRVGSRSELMDYAKKTGLVDTIEYYI